jgi:AcrR family transcriptional regulator
MTEETGLRARKHRRTREAIRNAALRLFVDHGYDDTAVEEIAEAADVSPRTFYRYFASKEEVIFDDPDAEAALRNVLAHPRPGEGDAESIARAVLEAMLANEERVRLARTIIDSTPALRARALQRVEETADLIAQNLPSTASRTGSAGMAARLRARILAHAIASAVRVAFFAWIESGRRGTAWAQCERALGVMRDALAPAGRKSKRGAARKRTGTL